MKVDNFARLSVLCENRVTALHLDLNADLGYWGDISIHADPPMSVRIGEIKDILALCWCPGMIVFLL